MLLRDRCDGTLIRDLDPFQKAVPYLMPTRIGATVYFQEDIDVEAALALAQRINAAAGNRRIRLFHLFMAAAVRVLAEKPRLNRFLIGKRFYQRNHIALSFIVKKRITEDARETNAKIVFDPSDTLDRVAERIDAAVAAARTDHLGSDEKELFLLSRIPGGLAVASALFRFLDRLNLAPPAMIRSDPLYTSMYVANLASLNLAAPFHHLFDWGTASLFLVIGKLERKRVRREDGGKEERRIVTIKLSLDERISEGVYYAHAIDLFKRLLQNPEALLDPPSGREG